MEVAYNVWGVMDGLPIGDAEDGGRNDCDLKNRNRVSCALVLYGPKAVKRTKN